MNSNTHTCEECLKYNNHRCEAFRNLYIENPDELAECEKFKGIYNYADYPDYYQPNR